MLRAHFTLPERHHHGKAEQRRIARLAKHLPSLGPTATAGKPSTPGTPPTHPSARATTSEARQDAPSTHT